MILTSLMVISVIVNNLLGIGGASISSDEELSQDNVCETKECVKMARKLKDNGNFEADPCDDFYEYACGNFIKTNNIAQHENTISSNMFIRNELNSAITHLLEDYSGHLSDQRPFKMMKTFYNACKRRNLNAQYNSSNRTDSSLNYLKNITNLARDWPVLNGNDPIVNYMDTILQFCQHGFNSDYLMKLALSVNPRNQSEYTIIIDQPSFLLPKWCLREGLNNKNVDAYYNLMLNVAELFGANRTQASEQLKEALSLEISLATVSSNYENREDYNYYFREVTFERLANISSHINFFRLINQYFAFKQNVSTAKILVHGYVYLLNINSILNTTKPKTVLNLIYWKTVLQSLPYLDGKFYTTYHNFLNNITDQNRTKPIRKECIETTKQMLPVILGSYYAQNYVPQSNENNRNRAALDEMIEEIRKRYIYNIFGKSVTMRHTAEQIVHANKMNSTVFISGFPDGFYDKKKLRHYYKKLNMSEGNYLFSVLEIEKLNRKNLKYLLKPNNAWKLLKDAFSISHTPDIYENRINVPDNLLDGSYYSSNLPNSVNYAVLGTMIGHEMFHHLIGMNIITARGGEIYTPIEHYICYKSYYGQFTEKNFKQHAINGSRTLHENMADVIGVEMAYTAYTAWHKNNPTYYSPLPGLTNFTANQLFWLSYANLFCEKSKITPTSLNNMYNNNKFAPARFRVLGPLMNLNSFADDFSCSRYSNMNFEERCRIYGFP